jgi:Domain of unknown function (DUF5666)
MLHPKTINGWGPKMMYFSSKMLRPAVSQLRIPQSIILKLALTGAVFGSMVTAQSVPAQSVASSHNASTTGAGQPADSTTDVALDPASLLPDLPPLPEAKATLIGGTVERLDRVRDQLTVQVFGGGKVKVAFDPRTHVYMSGSEASVSDIHTGDRIYVDTILNGSTVFARNIRLKTTGAAGESQGIVIDYHPGKGELSLRDALSPHALKIHVTPQTQFTHDQHTASTDELTPGTLVAVKFGAQAGSDIAREITVLAVPGSHFTFAGTVTAVDLRLGILTLESSTDHKTYEISFAPSIYVDPDNLHPGTNVSVLTRFDGNHYVASTVTVNSSNQ